MSQSVIKEFTAYRMEMRIVISAAIQMCHKYGGAHGALNIRAISFPIATGVFNPAHTIGEILDEHSWWNGSKDDIIKLMKAINQRDKGNSVFSLVLDEIRDFGDDVNMDLMMHVLHQGQSTRSLDHSEWVRYMNHKFPTAQHRAELSEAKSIVAKACGRIIHREFESNFINHFTPEQLDESIN